MPCMEIGQVRRKDQDPVKDLCARICSNVRLIFLFLNNTGY